MEPPYNVNNVGKFSLYVSVFLAGVAVGYTVRKPFFTAFKKLISDGPAKLVLVVREDLKMGKGKIAAQCCHATLGVYTKALKANPDMVEAWKLSGQQKVVVKTRNLEDILELKKVAQSKGIVTYLVRDAGRTQVAAGSETVLAIGPDSTVKLDTVTGQLSLL